MTAPCGCPDWDFAPATHDGQRYCQACDRDLPPEPIPPRRERGGTRGKWAVRFVIATLIIWPTIVVLATLEVLPGLR